VNDEGDGWYNCSWDSTGEPEGNWSINITTTLENYNSNISVWWNWFWLDNIEQTSGNQSVSPAVGGWGTNYTYNITINDPEGDTVGCYLWTNTTGSGWVLRGNDTVYGSGNCSILVTDFNWVDVGQAQYRFTINDTYNSFDTDNFTGPTINYDAVTIVHHSGNETDVNRSGDQTTLLMVEVNDTDYGYPNSTINTTFWISYTNGSTDYDTGFVNTTNSSGHVQYYYNATCSYTVGTHQWKAGVTDSRYNNTNTSEYLEINITGDLYSTIINPVGGVSGVYLRGTNQR
jgi:hypothetical protein